MHTKTLKQLLHSLPFFCNWKRSYKSYIKSPWTMIWGALILISHTFKMGSMQIRVHCIFFPVMEVKLCVFVSSDVLPFQCSCVPFVKLVGSTRGHPPNCSVSIWQFSYSLDSTLHQTGRLHHHSGCGRAGAHCGRGELLLKRFCL